MNPIRVTHIITGLSIGGAEKVLLRLLDTMDREGFDNRVISLTDLGPLSDGMRATGAHVSAMQFLKGRSNLAPLARLRAELRLQKPDLVQTWMYHADLIGGVMARASINAPVVWNLRQSTLDPRHSKKSTINTSKACAYLSSRVPHTIVCGSQAACEVHSKLGYDASKMLILRNGFNTQKYVPLADQRSAFRAQLNLPDDAILIGNPSRYDPQKDHQTFLQAATRVADEVANAHFVLCGDQITAQNDELMAALTKLGLCERVHLLGSLDAIIPYYAALDMLVLSSAYGEGAPNVLGEAMSMEIPCIATDIGDSADIVGDTGFIVPPREADALARAMVNLAQDPGARRARGQAARTRIEHFFPLATMVDRYEELYRRVYSQHYDF